MRIRLTFLVLTVSGVLSCSQSGSQDDSDAQTSDSSLPDGTVSDCCDSDGGIGDADLGDSAPDDACSPSGEIVMNAFDLVNAFGINAHIDRNSGIYSDNMQPLADGGTQLYAELQELGVSHVRSGLGNISSGAEARFAALHDHYKGATGQPITVLVASNPYRFPTQNGLQAAITAANGAIDLVEPVNEPNIYLDAGTWLADAIDYQHKVFNWIYDGGYSGPPVEVSISALGGYPALQLLVDPSNQFAGQGPWGTFQSVHSYPINIDVAGGDGGDSVKYYLPNSGSLKIGLEGRTVWCNPLTDGGLSCPASYPNAISTETGYTTCNTNSSPTCVSNSGAPGHLGVSEGAQAKYVPRVYLDTLQGGTSRVYLYELYDEGAPDSGLIEDNRGLIRHDGTHKPAFDRVKKLLTTLAVNSRGTATCSNPNVTVTTPGINHLLVRNGVTGDYQLLLWNEAPSYLINGKSYLDSGVCDGGTLSGCDRFNADIATTVTIGASATFSTATITYLDDQHSSSGCTASLTSSNASASITAGGSLTVCVPDEVTVVTLH